MRSSPAQTPPLLLDVEVDGKVGFHARSLLPLRGQHEQERRGRSTNVGGSRSTGTTTTPQSLPVVSGAEGWLPVLVDAGHQEAAVRSTKGKADDTHAAQARERLEGGEVDCPIDPCLDDEGSDVFFAVDLECVLLKYRRWHECFPRIKPFYAVKCNPNPEVVRILAELPGCGFDCASPAEMDQVLRHGVHPSRIIYANPCKEPSALRHAVSAGILTMTFDSADELYKIRRALDDRATTQSTSSGGNAAVKDDVQMVLRIKVPDAHSDCPLGEKFGAVEEVCSQLIALTIKLRLPLVGASFHCGSGCTDALAYTEALHVARLVFDLAARQGVVLTLLDIGGGFPGWDGSEYIYERPPQSQSHRDDKKTVGEISPSQGNLQMDPSACILGPPEYFDSDRREKLSADDRNSGPKSSDLDVRLEHSPQSSLPGETPVEGGLSAGETSSLPSVVGVEGSRTSKIAGAAPDELDQTADESAADGCTRTSLPKAPLSLADIARVTAPVLDKLFPPGCGVQIIAEPGRYFVEASHVLFTRIYAKRRLNIKDDSDPRSSKVNSDTPDNPIVETTVSKAITAYFIGEGLDGCFKDKVLCGVQFEPCPLRLADAGDHRPENRSGLGTAGVDLEAEETAAKAKEQGQLRRQGNDCDNPIRRQGWNNDTDYISGETHDQRLDRCTQFGLDTRENGAFNGKHNEPLKEEETEDALVMGPSGLQGDVVARERLPCTLHVGDWLYFSRMGAYTTSIASAAYSAACEAPFFYVASAPAVADGTESDGCAGIRGGAEVSARFREDVVQQ